MAETGDLERIGKAVARERIQRGWSQDKLAEEAGVHRQTVIRVEAGDMVQGATLVSICAAVGLHLSTYRLVCEHEWQQVCRVCGERVSAPCPWCNLRKGNRV